MKNLLVNRHTVNKRTTKEILPAFQAVRMTEVVHDIKAAWLGSLLLKQKSLPIRERLVERSVNNYSLIVYSSVRLVENQDDEKLQLLRLHPDESIQ